MNILEAEIKELTADRSELEYKCMDRLHEIEQLQLDNDKLREALEYQLTRTDDITDIRLIGEALSTTSQPVVLNNQTTQKPNLTYEDGFTHGYDAHEAEQGCLACVTCGELPAVKDSLTTQKPLSDEEIMNIKVKEGLGNWYNFARAIEKHHGIGE